MIIVKGWQNKTHILWKDHRKRCDFYQRIVKKDMTFVKGSQKKTWFLSKGCERSWDKISAKGSQKRHNFCHKVAKEMHFCQRIAKEMWFFSMDHKTRHKFHQRVKKKNANYVCWYVFTRRRGRWGGGFRILYALAKFQTCTLGLLPERFVWIDFMKAWNQTYCSINTDEGNKGTNPKFI